LTWNVFRSLRQIQPEAWLPSLWSEAFPEAAVPDDLRAAVHLWVSVPPPLGLLVEGDEGASETDVVIETGTWVWFIEAKHRSDIAVWRAGFKSCRKPKHRRNTHDIQGRSARIGGGV
jgi:hypothetical protein